MFMILTTIVITVTVLYFLLNHQLSSSARQEQEENLLKIARHVANEANVESAVETKQTSEQLQTYSNEISQEFDLDYTVILTIESIRLTHPNEKLINQPFKGNDEQRVFEGEEYVSTAKGSLGPSIRAFVPVYKDGNVVGAVSLGITMRSFQQTIQNSSRAALLISSIFGIIVSFIVAISLKKQLNDMEPHEIVGLLKERNAMMEYAKDAIIATNLQQEIVLANQEATKRFMHENKTLYQSISEVLPFAKDIQETLDQTEQTNETIYKFEGNHYVVSIAPILLQGKVIGHIYSLRDATELHFLLDQLYSTSNYAQSLQSQSHDFLNKLHVIYGLTDLEEYDELKNYLASLLEPEEEFTRRMAYLIYEPIIAGFLIGERHKFSLKTIPFSVEIHPDIPTAANPSCTKKWIQKVKEVNYHILLNRAEKVHVELGYLDKAILTTYHIKGLDSELEEMAKSLDQDAVHILVDRGSLKVTFKTGYRIKKNWMKKEES